MKRLLTLNVDSSLPPRALTSTSNSLPGTIGKGPDSSGHCFGVIYISVRTLNKGSSSIIINRRFPITSLMPTITSSNVGKGVACRKKEFCVEEGHGGWQRSWSFLQQLLSCVVRYRPTFSQVVITIRALPDDVLLEIFHFYMVAADWDADEPERDHKWRTLVHKCRRW